MLTPTSIKGSFIQVSEPGGYGNCEVPVISLPVINYTDLSFQLTFLADGADMNYLDEIFQAGPYAGQLGEFTASIAANTLTVTATTITLAIGNHIYGVGILPGTVITAFGSGTGGVGTYTVNLSNFVDSEQMATNVNFFNVMGGWGACSVAQGASPASTLPSAGLQWICTGLSLTGNTFMGVSEYVLYFQPNPDGIAFAFMPVGTCFNIYFYNVEFIKTVADGDYDTIANSYQVTGGLNTYTTFKKITDGEDGFPTSLLSYANNNDAFGFYYDFLPELVDNINYLNTIRLPLYLHSPEPAEDQMSYDKSDGSTLKLSHRVWTDYKFKTDYLPADVHNALLLATAHDLVYIQCNLSGIDPVLDGIDFYNYGNTPTQFIRTEKPTYNWQQTDIPRFKKAEAEGIIRLAIPEANVNSNCQ